MNWFKTSQNNNLFNNIYQLLISVYNNSGQSNELLSIILGQPIDMNSLDATIYSAKNKAIKDLNLETLTPEMQSAINTVVISLRGSTDTKVQEEQIVSPESEENLENLTPIGEEVA